jgi:hypothetical protein
MDAHDDRSTRTQPNGDEGWEVVFEHEETPRKRLSDHERWVIAHLLSDNAANTSTTGM